jgi:hypothetical protein
MANTDLSTLPFNIEVLYLTATDVTKLKPITSLFIFDNTNNFHPEGLFSTEIFGLVGSEYRNRSFSYIDVRVDVLHPIFYYLITKTVAWYDNILSGKEYAVWNPKTKEFEKSNLVEGKTGYSFFMEHVEELHLEPTESTAREFNIKLYHKLVAEKKYMMRYLLVLPAGMRDYSMDKNGRPQEDEINALYRKVIMQSNLIDASMNKNNVSSVDSIRYSIQNLIQDIFVYIKSLLEGKNKLIAGKWLTRKTFNSTRNVASANIEKVTSLNDSNRLKYNETAVGLHQFLRVLMPKTIYDIKSGFLTQVFSPNSEIATLTNAKTYKKETIALTEIVKDYDTWMSPDGIEKVMANYGNLETRHDVITLNKGKHYLGLLYNDGKYYKLLQDIDEVPPGFDKSKVYPLTVTELLYLSVYHNDGKIPGFVTRYPISSYGSVYPCFIKLRTTSEVQELILLDDMWQATDTVAKAFPMRGKDFFNTMTAHSTHNERLTLDFDGDVISLQAVLSDEAQAEIRAKLNSKSYYISNQNKFMFSLSNDTLNTTLAYMT